MNLSLTPELEQFIDAKVKSGRFQTASEVVREGLRLLDVQDQMRDAQLVEVREKIKTGLDQLDRGEGIPGEQVEANLKRASAAFRAKRK